MVDSFDQSAILESFVAEVRSYLPRIKEGVEGHVADPTQPGLLEESYRLAHTVKNSSLMMGYPNLSKLALPLEDVLRDAMEGRAGIWAETVVAINRSLERCGAALDGLAGAKVDEKRLVKENDGDFRALRDLVKKGKVTEVIAVGEAMEESLTVAEDEAVAIPVSTALGSEAVEELPGSGAPAMDEQLVVGPEGQADSIAEDGQEDLGLVKEVPTGIEEPSLSLEVPIDTPTVPDVDLDRIVVLLQPDSSTEIAGVESASAEMVEALALPEVSADNTLHDGVVLESVDERVLTEEAPAQPIEFLTLGAVADEEVASATLHEPIVEVTVPLVEFPGETLASQTFAALEELANRMLEEPAQADTDGNGFMKAINLLEEYASYLEGVFDKLEEHVGKAKNAMGSLMALKPRTMNMALLPNRRHALTFNAAQGLATPLADIAATMEDLLSSKQRLKEAATGIEHAMETLKQGDKAVVSPIVEAAPVEQTQNQLSDLRAELEKEIQEAMLAEMAAERELAERHEAERWERYEVELRNRLEAEIRSELAMQFAHAAQMAKPTLSARVLAIATSSEGEEDEYEELPQELVEAFNLEAQDHFLNIGRDLSALEKSPGNPDLLRSIRRSVHTLKGAAASMGLRVTGELAHTLEDLLDAANEGRLEIEPVVERLILDTFNALEGLVAAVLAGQKEDRGVLDAMKPRFEEILASVRPEEEEETGQEESNAPASEAVAGGDQTALAKRAGLQVHVGIEQLDDVVNLVGELVISRASFEQHVAGLKQSLEELDLSTLRLKHLSQNLAAGYEVAALMRVDTHRNMGPYGAGERPAVYNLYSRRGNGDGESVSHYGGLSQHHLEFDELELDRYTEFHRLIRELTETTTDMGTVHGEMETVLAQFETVSTRQSRVNSDLQDKLMRLRLVPLHNLTPRLYRAVRNVALSEGKEVDLVLEGEDVEVDKTVFEGISDPLLHLMRNAVDHGIESVSDRRTAGKADKGTVIFQAYYEGNEVIIRVRDDGRGISASAVRAAAVARGLIGEGEKLSNAELFDLLFQPGFSTAAEITETSGRGVGLDVVRTNISRLRGTVQITSAPGQGTTFTIRLPLTLAVTTAQLVKSGHEIFAVPLSQIEQILRLSDQHISSIGPGRFLTIEGQHYPVHKLSESLGLPEPLERTKSWVPVLIAGTTSRKMALVVDEILGQQEIVIKTLGDHFRSLKGVSGGTILGNGQVVLILNVIDFLREDATPVTATMASTARPTASGPLSVLIVDDSPSVRRVVSTALSKAGLDVSSAKDGVEALDFVQFNRPDVILLDVEMPRMDGYELLSILRNQAAYRDIPVVMLTSRSGNKHRQKAMQLGANGYMVKPYKDEELVATLRNVVAANLVLVS